ncbi:MAG: gamma-glutamylcyclotransferase family protein [Opitutales bacterium]
MAEALFVYGTLMAPEVMEAVAGYLPASTLAQVNGYARFRLVDRDYPGLVKEAGASAEGLLYRDVTPEAVERVDAFEDTFYERQSVTVQPLDGGDPVEASAYVVPFLAAAELVDPRPWDYQHFRETVLPVYVDRIRNAPGERQG